jgi:hypothetical protein
MVMVLLFHSSFPCCTLDPKNKAPFRSFKMINLAGHWRLTPIILATWEAEIRRIAVWGRSVQKLQETTSQPIYGKNSVHLSSQATKLPGNLRSGELPFQASPGKKSLWDSISMDKSWAWWYIPVIPSNGRKQSRRITVVAQPGQKEGH